MLNRIDLKGFRKVQEEYKQDRSKCKKRLQVEGKWRLDVEYGPQFETKLRTERAGEITVQTDETIILGVEEQPFIPFITVWRVFVVVLLQLLPNGLL